MEKVWKRVLCIKEGKSVKINIKKSKINQPYNCNSYNMVYAGICTKKGNVRKHI